MKLFLVALLCLPVSAAELGPLAIAQQLFDAMARHDAVAANQLFIPGATLTSVNPDGKPSSLPFEKWTSIMGASKDTWLERIWKPVVMEHGEVAVVWAEYDFHLNGKFSHCGVDSFSLIKTASGWKISGISDTRETTGCAPSPLGPPAK
jgi:hypothetical protein